MKKIGISKTIIALSLYIAAMLFQTPYLNLGTRVGALTVGITLVCMLFESHRLNWSNTVPKSLLWFFIYSILITLIILNINPVFPPNFVRYMVVVSFFLLISPLSIKENEYVYLKTVLWISMTVYAVLIIRACQNNPYMVYHGEIELFGTNMDPNYVGLPIVAASLILIGDLLYSRKYILVKGVCLTILLLSVIYTASRGTSLSLLVGALIIFYGYMRNKRLSIGKIMTVLIVIVVVVFLIRYVSANYFDAIDRMTNTDSEYDSGRFELWNMSLQKWMDNPLFGWGLGAGTKFIGRPSHSTYVQLLLETGIVGFVLFVSFMGQMAKKAFHHSYALGAAVIALYFQIAFLNTLDNRCVWGILSIVAILPPTNRKTI